MKTSYNHGYLMTSLREAFEDLDNSGKEAFDNYCTNKKLDPYCREKDYSVEYNDAYTNALSIYHYICDTAFADHQYNRGKK